MDILQKDIFDGNYTIYSDGRLYSNLSNKFLKPSTDGRRGYKKYKLYMNGKKTMVSEHRLVMLAFNPNTSGKIMEVDHIDGDITNNNLSNLRWIEPVKNKREKGKHFIRNNVFELKDEICKAYFISGHSISKISLDYKLDTQSVSDLIKGRRFKGYAEEWCRVNKFPYYIR